MLRISYNTKISFGIELAGSIYFYKNNNKGILLKVIGTFDNSSLSKTTKNCTR